MSNEFSLHSLLNPLPIDEAFVERISHRTKKPSLSILDYDPTWPSSYSLFASRIITALGSPGSKNLISISHVGSTSVPGLPAKGIIDIDIVVPLINNEETYATQLEAQGFQFMLREPKWYDHRFFTASEPMFANVHVFGPGCAMVERHRVFRDWLRESESDRELYARVKREASEISTKGGETVMEYSDRKDWVVREIMERACKGFGIGEGEEGKGRE